MLENYTNMIPTENNFERPLTKALIILPVLISTTVMQPTKKKSPKSHITCSRHGLSSQKKKKRQTWAKALTHDTNRQQEHNVQPTNTASAAWG